MYRSSSIRRGVHATITTLAAFGLLGQLRWRSRTPPVPPSGGGPGRVPAPRRAFHPADRRPGAPDAGHVNINDRPLSDDPPASRTPHGFVRRPVGRITTVDLPAGFDGAAVTDINNRGHIVGQTLDADGRGIGFLRDAGGRVTPLKLARSRGRRGLPRRRRPRPDRHPGPRHWPRTGHPVTPKVGFGTGPGDAALR